LINNSLKTSYNEELANIELEKLKQIKTKKIFYCKDCGKEISYGATRCADCANKYYSAVKEKPNR
jgi:predicted RNA-binding Zn-ribbon protein involved in translation (DUF1610 family)